MKKTLLAFFSLFFTMQLSAQSGTCMPDTTVMDTTGGFGVIFPLPYDETTMTGGIPVTACNNQPFELIFTANIPEFIEFDQLPFPVEVNYMEITEDGVKNLPNGLTYACNPPTCLFEAGTFGCVTIYGTPDDMEGPYDLKLDIFVSTAVVETPSEEPGNLFPGSYTLVLEEENAGTCFVVSTNDFLQENLKFSNTPNPFGGTTTINISSGITQKVFFEVHDLLGNRVHTQELTLTEGSNQLDFDGSHLAEGMYLYSFRKKNAIVSRKMVITR